MIEHPQDSSKKRRADSFTIARVVAAALLLLALADLPYGYYTILRLLVFAVGAYGAYLAYLARQQGWTWTLGAIAVLFNPLFPIYLEREVWAPIDIGVAVVLLVSLRTVTGVKVD